MKIVIVHVRTYVVLYVRVSCTILVCARVCVRIRVIVRIRLSVCVCDCFFGSTQVGYEPEKYIGR